MCSKHNLSTLFHRNIIKIIHVDKMGKRDI